MQTRDAVILLMVGTLVLFSFQQSGYFLLEPSWLVPVDTSYFENGHFPNERERLPAPQIVDLDGDDKNEVLIATPDSKIKILQAPSDRNFGIQTLETKAEATLLPVVGASTGRRAVAMGTGFLKTFGGDNVRQRVIVVVTDGWTILLFDHTLKLLWESNVMDNLNVNHKYHSETAILITPTSIRVGDHGLVVVGSRLKSVKEGNIRTHKQGAHGKHDDMDDDEDHFSYFAFDGRTGALRWKHEAGDFYGTDLHDSEKASLLPEHSYKMHVISKVRHLGEMDWREFRKSMFQHLPHNWYSTEDTQMTLSHFKKTYKSGGNTPNKDKQRLKSDTDPNEEWNSELLGVPKDHPIYIPGLPFGGNAPHNAQDFVTKPNVLVTHLSTGIEVIHIYTGRPVCSLALGSGFYEDITGDGLIEHVQLLDKHTQSTCGALATSGIPVQKELFNVSLCWNNEQGIVGKYFAMKRNIRDRKVSGVDGANVISLPVPITVWRSTRSYERDMVFLVSSGKMSSYSAIGKLNWQIETAAGWRTGRESVKAKRKLQKLANPWGTHISNEKDSFVADAILPSVDRFYPEVYSKDEYILAVGESIAIVSPHGDILTETPVGGIPISRVSFGDFNNDGLTDVIVTTTNAYLGFALKTTATGSVLFPTLVGVLLVIMAMSFVYANIPSNSSKRRY